jgi:hypothetical protein
MRHNAQRDAQGIAAFARLFLVAVDAVVGRLIIWRRSDKGCRFGFAEDAEAREESVDQPDERD